MILHDAARILTAHGCKVTELRALSHVRVIMPNGSVRRLGLYDAPSKLAMTDQRDNVVDSFDDLTALVTAYPKALKRKVVRR